MLVSTLELYGDTIRPEQQQNNHTILNKSNAFYQNL